MYPSTRVGVYEDLCICETDGSVIDFCALFISKYVLVRQLELWLTVTSFMGLKYKMTKFTWKDGKIS